MNNKRILFLVNHDIVIYNFRKELVEKLLELGYEVIISSPYGERIKFLEDMGCKWIDVELNRHGKNLVGEIKLLKYYFNLLKKIKPGMVLTYTIKPNIYGGLACRMHKIPYMVNITGLGTAVENSSILQKFLLFLYKIALKKSHMVFVQNDENKIFMDDHKLAEGKLKKIPGSGVNLNHFKVIPYPIDNLIEFVFISRIKQEKGIDQYLEAAEYIKKKYPNTVFHICGFCEDEYMNRLETLQEQGIIKYHGLVLDIREVLKVTQCTIHPTYYPEGISNVLLESCASGRPIITTDRSGCKEVLEDKVNGYLVQQKDTKDLIRVIEMFLTLNNDEKRMMGLKGRLKVENEFDRNIVVNTYIQEIKKFC